QVPVQTQHIAYCIYTSGSTGQPKGVLIEHKGIPNLAFSKIESYCIRPGSRIFQFSSLSFDASVVELFTTLSAGATLYLEPSDTPLVGSSLLNILQEKAIKALTLPPSILATLDASQQTSLESLAVAGEACEGGLVRSWAAKSRFFNAYGPTEGTVCA